MIVEQRTYDIQPGRIPAYLALYEAEGLEVQRTHLGRLLGYYSSEFGTLNQIVHHWAYDDLADRARRRAALFADPRWRAYFDRVLPLIVKQHSTILVPAPFVRPVPAEIGAAA